jgi:hypothetical protein
MSTPTDHFQTNTHFKKSPPIGGVSWPESRVQVRQTPKQWLCSVLASPATARPLQGRVHQSPPPKSTKLHFSHAGPCFSGHTISHQVQGHVKTRQQSTCAQFCAIERVQQRAQEAKRACLGDAARQACPLFVWLGNFTVVVRKGLKDTKSTHRARGRIFWQPRRAHN